MLGGSWGVIASGSQGAVRVALGDGLNIEFTSNALARRLDRSIGEDEIRAALETPDHLGPSFENRWRARKAIGGRTLEVIFWRHRDHTEVVTAYWQETAS